jgi:hypothetical protein
MVSLSNHGGIFVSPFDKLKACPVLDTGVSGELKSICYTTSLDAE